jgi:hypothetical protein
MPKFLALRDRQIEVKSSQTIADLLVVKHQHMAGNHQNLLKGH